MFSGEVISSYAVPKKPFWEPLEPDTTMRCLGAIMQRIYRGAEEKRNRSKRVSGKSCVLNAHQSSCVEEDKLKQVEKSSVAWRRDCVVSFPRHPYYLRTSSATTGRKENTRGQSGCSLNINTSVYCIGAFISFRLIVSEHSFRHWWLTSNGSSNRANRNHDWRR